MADSADVDRSAVAVLSGLGRTADSGAQFALRPTYDRYITNGNRALTVGVKTRTPATFSKPSKPPKQ
jgi:hypothetical protein